MTLTSRPALLFSILFWLAATAFGAYFLLTIEKRLNFGIDLVGGTYITLEVELNKAIENELVEAMQSVNKKLADDQKNPAGAPKVEAETGILTFDSAKDAKVAYDLATAQKDQRLIYTLQDKQLKFNFSTAALREIKADAMEGNINVLRTRLDAFGVGEVNIASHGDHDIIIELPNVDNPEEAKARIGKTALLEMKPIFDSAATKDALLEKLGGSLPDGTMILQASQSEGKHGDNFFLVPTYAEVTGRMLKDARMDFNQDKFEYVVAFTFNSNGAEKFHDLTAKNVGGRIGIILDNLVISAPGVSHAIDTPSAIIQGSFTKESAQSLASLLKSGAFVAPVKYAEERHIGPSLGKESINSGLLSCAIALGLLFLFCIFFYKVAGILAFIVLIYNLLFILFGLSTLGATLTLPGIAGMVLIIGMAIDASILIYERIKEELAAGASMRNAVSAGFSGATTVILDANITTFIVAIVLYWLGTGPIQGFATTMMIGIISTLITGLWLLKTLFNINFDVLGVQKIKI